MRPAAVFDERAEEHAERGDEQPRTALEQFDDAPTDEEGEQSEHRDGQRKFHCANHTNSPAPRKPSRNLVVLWFGSTAAPAVVRCALAPNASHGLKPFALALLRPSQRPTTRASSAAPGAGALPNYTNTRTVAFFTAATLETAKTGVFDVFKPKNDVFAPANAPLRDDNVPLHGRNATLRAAMPHYKSAMRCCASAMPHYKSAMRCYASAMLHYTSAMRRCASAMLHYTRTMPRFWREKWHRQGRMGCLAGRVEGGQRRAGHPHLLAGRRPCPKIAQPFMAGLIVQQRVKVPDGTKENVRVFLPSLPGLDAGWRAATQS